jgi:hypothetical protein
MRSTQTSRTQLHTAYSRTAKGQRTQLLANPPPHDEILPNPIHIADGHILNKLLLDSICGAVVMIKPTETSDIHQTTYPKGIQKLLQQYTNIFSTPTTPRFVTTLFLLPIVQKNY